MSTTKRALGDSVNVRTWMMLSAHRTENQKHTHNPNGVAGNSSHCCYRIRNTCTGTAQRDAEHTLIRVEGDESSFHAMDLFFTRVAIPTVACLLFSINFSPSLSLCRRISLLVYSALNSSRAS